ncbi:mCG146916 [Mus musculus]|nr:mCG146916 [Mus musculus]
MKCFCFFISALSLRTLASTSSAVHLRLVAILGKKYDNDRCHQALSFSAPVSHVLVQWNIQ